MRRFYSRLVKGRVNGLRQSGGASAVVSPPAEPPAVSAPTWGTIPDVNIDQGDPVGISLASYIADDGGDASITFALASGSLPAGITLNANGTFSGTATTAQAVNPVFSATNSGGTSSPNAGHTVTVADVTNPVAGTLSLVVDSDSQITVSHSGASDNVGIDHIVLERSPNGTSGWTTLSADASFPYADSGLTASTAYYYRATVYDAAGNNATTATVNDTTNAPAGASFANALWYDDFNYTVTEGETFNSESDNPFTQNGPWNSAKDNRISAGARGTLSTVDPTTLTAFGGVNPTRNGTRVLRVYANASAGQTDLYLGKADDGNPQNIWPADCWIQQILGLHRSGSEMSQFSSQGTKWLYPCRGGLYGCTTMSNLIQLRGYAGTPTCATMPDLTTGWYPLDDGSENRPGNDQHSWDATGTPCEGDFIPNRRGPSNSSFYFAPNTWYFTKWHCSTDGVNGLIELWVREYGSPTWVKWIEWIGNVTTDYQYAVAAINQGVGHDYFKLFTTFNDVDTWLYTGDFQIATSEANLENGYSDAA